MINFLFANLLFFFKPIFGSKTFFIISTNNIFTLIHIINLTQDDLFCNLLNNIFLSP